MPYNGAMAEIPPISMPDPAQFPPKRSNTLIWVLLIVGVGAMCIVLLIVAAILFPVFAQARLAAQKTACLSNVKQLGIGHLMYASDFDDRNAPAEGWNRSIMPYVKAEQTFTCPLLKEEGGSGYAMNQALGGFDGKKLKAVDQTILLFESRDTTLGATGGEGDLCLPGRHSGSNAIGYADGHVKSVPDSAPPGSWSP